MNWKKYLHVVRKNAAFFGVLIGIGTLFISWSSVDIADSYEKFFPKLGEEVVHEPPRPKHLPTPRSVRAIYMSSWVAGTKDWRDDLARFVESSELNSIVIDVKDYSGRVSFQTDDEIINASGSEEQRIRDIKDFIESLHDSGIYTIARITVFQDPFYAKRNQNIAVKKKSGALWKDRNGLSYIDPAARDYWDYIVRIGQAAEKMGFDELNFDYIRYPSDGNMKDIMFPISGAQEKSKQEILGEFFSYLHGRLKDIGIPLSADVFGMTMTNTDDLNIGQVLETIEPYFDFVAPMVYPSHYPLTFQGFKNPAEHPYEVVYFAMTSGVERMKMASSSPEKLRPWIQDFNLGAEYDAAKIEAQKKAVYDSGLTSWMSWDPSNKYTRDAYLPQ